MGSFTFLPKIHERLANVSGRPVISNCGTPTEKVSEYLDFLLKPVMKYGWSYIKDTGDFFKKNQTFRENTWDATLVISDVVGIYPNIPHGLGLHYLRKIFNKTGICKVPKEEIISMAVYSQKQLLWV